MDWAAPVYNVVLTVVLFDVVGGFFLGYFAGFVSLAFGKK